MMTMNQMKKIKLFLSSTFDQLMINQRDLFRNELLFRLEEELGQYGVYFYLYDFELGIPVNTKPEHVIRMCLQAVKKSNIFIGIVGSEYGTPIQSFLKDVEEQKKLKKEYPVLAHAISRNVSVLELEFLYAMYFERKNRLFFVVKNNIKNQKVQRLISKIRQSGQKCKEVVSYKEIESSVIQWVLSIIYSNLKNMHPSMLTAYAVRKTKYYVEDKQITDIYQYLKSSSRKVLCIYGEKGSGKTVMVARMYLEQYLQGMFFVFVGCNAYTLSEVILILLKQVYEYYGISMAKLNTIYSEKGYVQLFHETMKTIASYSLKCCFIIDGVEKIHILDVFSINVILPDRLPKNVKMVITTDDKALIYNKKAFFLQHIAINQYKMLGEMLKAQGKQKERIHIEKNKVFRKRAEISLEYVYVFISELIVAAKYDTIKIMLYKQAFQAGTLVDLYIIFLQRILRRFIDRADYIRNFLLYLIFTENGLTKKELEFLIGYVDRDILCFLYPYLEITGESRMLIDSKEFCNAVCRVWEIGEKEVQIFRKHIVNVCLKSAEEDPVLGRELLYQLSHIHDNILAEQILNNIQIVDSITYYNEEYAFYQFQKFSNFERCLDNWSKTEVTEKNYIYMFTVVNIELEQEMFGNAKKHLETMLVLLNQGRIPKSYAGNIYNHLSVLYAKQLQYREAGRYAKEAIQAGQKNTENLFQLCEYENVLCRVYLNTGHYEKAYTLGCKLLELYDSPFYEDTINRLRIKITLLHILNKQKRDHEYQREYAWLLPRLEAMFGKIHPEVMDVQVLNIYYLMQRGHLKQAQKQCDKMRKIIQYDSKYQLKLLLVESDIYYYMRNWKKEAKVLKEAGKILETEGKKEKLEAVSWYESIMFYYIETGRPKKAIKIGKRIYNLLNQFGEFSLYGINNFLNMGAAYENMGLNQIAMKCYENAIKILNQQRGISKIKQADIYNQIGSSSQNMQLYSKAYSAYRKALNILKCSYVQDNLYGIVLNNMGQLMHETKNDEKALNYYGRALRYYYKHFTENDMYIANTLDNVGSIFDMREEYRKAAYFHLKGLQYRLKRGGLYTPSTVTSLHNLANTWYLDGRYFSACIAESLAVWGLRKQEKSIDDYSIYMCMGKILEHMYLRSLAFRYYMRTYHLLNIKKEMISEKAEIYLILATFDKDWEKNPYSVKMLLKAVTLLENKKERGRKDYELKVAVYFSLERYSYYHNRYEEALKYLDAAEKIIDFKMNRKEYEDIYEMISAIREEIEEHMA